MATPSITSMRHVIPPARVSLWRHARIRNHAVTARPTAARHASSTPKAKVKGKGNTLEKPLKFNPPSHGARLPRNTGRLAQQHYGGDLSSVELAAQKVKNYPGMMAPKGSFEWKFWHSPMLHVFITMGTLTCLTLYVFIENIKHDSPYKDMLPKGSDYAAHPIASIKTFYEVWRLSTAYRSNEVGEGRRRRVDDVTKRKMYRKAHGIEEQKGILGIGGGSSTEEEQNQTATEGEKNQQAAEDDKAEEEDYVSAARRRWPQGLAPLHGQYPPEQATEGDDGKPQYHRPKSILKMAIGVVAPREEKKGDKPEE